MPRPCPLTKGGCCIWNKHLVDGNRRRHPFLSANRNHASPPHPAPISHYPRRRHLFLSAHRHHKSPPTQSQIPFHATPLQMNPNSIISWTKMSENLICFPVLQTLPTLPKWFYFLLSKGNHQPRLKLVSCPTPMKALSGVSRLQVLQNEGVWSPTGRKMQSVES